MKYINRAARYTQEEENRTKGRFYKYIYKNKLLAAKELLTRIKNQCEGSEHAAVEAENICQGNWEYIQRAFHDKHVLGCSAEGHVSSVYSGTDEFQADGMERDRHRPDVQAEMFYPKLWTGKGNRSRKLSERTGTVCNSSNRNDWDY